MAAIESQLRICRVCAGGGEELTPISEKNKKIFFKITNCELKLLEFNNYKVPALICPSCLKDLVSSMKLRKKSRKTDDWLKKLGISEVEALICNANQEASAIEIHQNNQAIKEEFPEENPLPGSLEENLDGSEEQSQLTDALKLPKKEETSSEFSDSESETVNGAINQNKSSNPELSAQCNLCFKTLTGPKPLRIDKQSSIQVMKDHMRAVHQKLDESEMFKCPHCDRLFKMKCYLNRHMKSFHSKQIAKKEIRSKNRAGQSKFESEDIFKEKLSGLNCPYCNKFLTSKHSLNDHIRVRHEFINFSERFLCDICGKDFPLKYYLLRHIRASHLKTLSYKKKSEDQLPCSICGKILKSKGNLSTHEKTHRILSPDEYWYCDLCGNKFKGRGEMTVHIKKRHLFKIRYPCELCPGKSWRTLFQLQRHVKVIHHNIREFKCEWCGKEFGEKNKLVCHLRIHTGEQPFKCNFAGCTRAFTHQTDLRRHHWGHTGERPYKCQNEACLKGFMKKSELKAHESRCHPAAQRLNVPNVIPFQYQMM